MVDPVSLSLISLGATAAGGAASAFGAMRGAQSQAAMYNYQAGISQQNQQIQKQNMDTALASGEQNAATSGMATRARLGQIIAAQGASGFNVNSGTQVNVQKSQEAVGQTEQRLIRQNSAKAAYDFDIGAVQAGEQAEAYSAAGVNAKTAGGINVMSSILGTAGSVSGKWLQGTQSGIFPAWGAA